MSTAGSWLLYFLKSDSFLAPASLDLIFSFSYRFAADSLSPWRDCLLHWRREAAPAAATRRMRAKKKNKIRAGGRGSILESRSDPATLRRWEYLASPERLPSVVGYFWVIWLFGFFPVFIFGFFFPVHFFLITNRAAEVSGSNGANRGLGLAARHSMCRTRIWNQIFFYFP